MPVNLPAKFRVKPNTQSPGSQQILRFLVLSLALLLTTCLLCNAQDHGVLHIRIVSAADSTAVPFARITVSLQSRSPLASTMTGANGSAFLKLPDTTKGNIVVAVKILGYEDFQSAPFQFDNSDTNAKIFYLRKASYQLKEVLILQRRVESNGGKLIYHVRQDQFAAGTTTAELFPKMPGVTLSPTGELRLNGKTGVLVLVDGKGELKSQADQVAFLAGLSSDQVDRIEIIDHPSARYDASVRAVINIITKKVKGYSNVRGMYTQPLYMDGKKAGFNYPSGGGGTSLNFLVGKVRSSFNLSADNTTGIENSVSTRTINNLLRSTGTNLSENYLLYIAPKLTLDCDISHRSSISIIADLKYSPYDINNTNSSYDFYNYSTNALDSTTRVSNKLRINSTKTNLTGSYKYLLDTGRQSLLYINFIYAHNPFTQRNVLEDPEATGSLSPAISNHIDGLFNIYSASAIFTDLVKKTYLSTEFGLKFNALDNATTQELNMENNKFTYAERLAAFFLSGTWTFGKYVLTTELRNEWLHATSAFRTSSLQQVKNSYFKVYPNLTLQKNVNDNFSLSLNYAKKIKRPLAAYQNPSQNFSSYYNRTKGTLDYLPSYYDNIQGDLHYKNFGFTIYYEHTINQRTLLPTSDPFVFTGTNLGIFNEYGLSVNQSFELGKWFSSQANFDVSRTTKGNDGLTYIHNHWTTYDISSNSDFTLSKSTRINVNLAYTSNNYAAFSIFNDFFSSAVELTQLFLKDKMTLSIGVDDPFGLKKLRSANEFPQQFEAIRQTTNGRMLTLRMIYKFKFGSNFTRQRYKDKNDGEIRY